MSKFGEKLLPKDIAKELNISKDFGIGLFDLALFPTSKSFIVELFAWDATNFPIKWRDASQDEIKKDLLKEELPSSSWKYSLLSLLQNYLPSLYYRKLCLSTKHCETEIHLPVYLAEDQRA